MNAIEIMMEEHKNIKRMLLVMRKYCYKVFKNEEVDYNDFYRMIDFVRSYADKHHHMKEENILFKKMSSELGERVEKGPIMGMLVEHDLGRLYMQNLESALKEVEKGNEEAKLDVIANAISYTDLLNRHIDKEDTVIYTFGEKSLSKEIIAIVDEESLKVEEEANEKGVQDKYLSLIDELEGKVGIK